MAVELAWPENDKSVQEIISSVGELENASVSLVITGEKELANASDMLARVAKLRKQLEERRKFFTQPLNDQVKKINNLFKMWSEPLDRIDRKLRDAIAAYRAEAERKRREEEEFNRRKQELLARLAGKKGQEPPPPPPPVETMPAPAAVRTKSGLVTTRKVWTFKVVDESLIPREYLVLDEAKVRKAISAGVREIPGLSIYQQEEVVVR